MEIRLLRPEEVELATQLMAGNYPDHPEYAVKARSEIASMFVEHPVRPQFVVAMEGDTMIGFAGIAPSWFDYGVWEILWVNVIGEQQGKGVGTQMVQYVIDMARAEKRDMIVLSCTAPKFYERFGFRVLSPLANDYMLMALSLKEETRNKTSQ
jgi:GNAT superfamily N-acetyltransferase